jgi:Ca-activated chloride channel family protein
MFYRAKEYGHQVILVLAIIAIVLGSITPLPLLAGQLEAQEAQDPSAGGALMLRGKGVEQALPAMRLGTDYAVKVSGPTARVTVTQAFRNTGKNWMEATYLYPLPEDGAVDSLKMVVGQRIFIGKIKPREEAKKIYEKALSEGRKAGLVEQQRANLFRNNVANVGPGETVVIAIEFQAPVRQVGGRFSLRLPLVAGLRYVPPHSLTGAEQFRDAAAITAPIAHPALGRDLNPVSISVELSPGFEPAEIASPYHRIAVRPNGPQSRLVTLASGEVPADRDFELRWHPAGSAPELALFKQRHNGLDYVMAALIPPADTGKGPIPPREMVFVIDNSGSMSGTSMPAAKASLLHALGTLRKQDSFNIIRFDDTMTKLFGNSVPATPEQIAVARRFTESLEANGGTEMLPALKAALVEGGTAGGKAIRQVVFLTDGGLSNESEMMAEIAANGGRSRIFMVGIGSAPNNFLMNRMAQAGRGTYTNIAEGDDVGGEMQALLDRLAAPIAHKLSVAIEGGRLDFAPDPLPDLYAGEPLVLLARNKHIGGKMTLSGMLGDRPWSRTIDLDRARPSEVVARLWANRHVTDLEAQRWSGQLDDELADAAIAETGMQFGIVTGQTSLIAEDATPSRPNGARLSREELPLLLPAGWNFNHLFGDQGLAGVNSGTSGDSGQGVPLELPQTATNFAEAIMRGLLLTVLGLLGLSGLRRRKVLP